MAYEQDKEIQLYRDLMKVPDQFESGFGPKMIVAALFLGFLMVPGSIYLSLFMGAGLGPAAQWVTVILFAEVARRSMKSLRQQEIYLLFFMTSIALGGTAGGGVFSGLLWNQYLAQAPAVSGLGVEIPWWVAPPREVLEGADRTFLTAAWLRPILFIIGMMVISRIDSFGLGYALYRLTSHVERLPFPMAPSHALSITALAESRDEPAQRWKWRCFSIGGVLGLGFGLIYIGLPSITGTLFNSPVKLIPIPWLDLTDTISTETFMPATALNLVFDAGLLILGMVLPFWAVVGGFIGLLVTLVLNPILYHQGVLSSWRPGMKIVDTLFHNYIDFYLSFGIGMSLAIFLVSLWPIIKSLIRMRSGAAGKQEEQATRRTWRQFLSELLTRNRNRGDISIIVSLCIYIGSTLLYISICRWLMPDNPATPRNEGFPVWFFLGFAFIYTPMISYVNAKLEGMVGQSIQIPRVREAAFILSGFKGSQIWFAPIPLSDYGGATRNFRAMELTGTRLTDIIKVELLTIPILAVTSLLFSEMIWRLAPIPSAVYPFTQEIWDLQARNFALAVTATSEGTSQFLEALKLKTILTGTGVGVGLFLILAFFNLPTFLVYGLVRSLGQMTPGHVLPEMIGALIGRFYFQKRFGPANYKRYVMVVMAGFSAGVGLVGMASVAFALIAKSTTTLGY